MPVLDPPGAVLGVVLDPPGVVVDDPGVVVDEPLPVVLPEVPPALLDEPCSCRQRSFSVPVSESHCAAPVAPVDEDPLTPVDEEPVLLPLVPAEGVVALLPLPMLPDPVLLPEVCAKALPMANSAAALAETMSFSFMKALL